MARRGEIGATQKLIKSSASQLKHLGILRLYITLRTSSGGSRTEFGRKRKILNVTAESEMPHIPKLGENYDNLICLPSLMMKSLVVINDVMRYSILKRSVKMLDPE